MPESEIDPGLIEECRHGDRDAFHRLFEAHKDRVYTIALYFLHGDATAAEDVSQEVFVRLFTAIRSFRGEANFTTWLYRLVANACIDEQRKRKRFLPLDAVESAPPGDVMQENAYVRFETHDAVQSALADLSPEMRMTVLLKYFEELSYEEMADVLDCSKGTVASRLNRGLKILAQKLAFLRDAIATGE
ncbi:MAG TPA: sigma-70 family RNA polymerase sigma factor [Chthonomonadaceae bacterium]|nr:sigma-70 family RNA polymerase sigma factor [Chthonomonadaceae bacterium]